MGFVEGWGGGALGWKDVARLTWLRKRAGIAERRRELRDDMLAAEVTCGAMAMTSDKHNRAKNL